MTRPNTRNEPLDPMIAAELAQLELALSGSPGADAELAEIVREVRASAPSMDDSFRAALDARAQAGFPREGGRGPSWLARIWPTSAALRPALAIAATVTLGLAVATVMLTGGDGPTPTSGLESFDGAVSTGGGAAPPLADQATPSLASPTPAPQADAVAPAQTEAAPSSPTLGAPASKVAPVPGATALGGLRRVERSAELTLSTAPDDVQAVADGVVRTVQGLGGVVASSRVNTFDGGGEAYFDLRLPTSRLDRAIGQLSKLAHVSALTQGSDDITSAFVSTADRLKDARDERAALLRALGNAVTDRQVASLRLRIAESRRRIARLEGEMRALRARTDRATVTLTVLGDGKSGGGVSTGDGKWTPGDALKDALRVLEVAAGVAVIAAAVLVPLGLLALLAALAARSARRRSRERSLDAAA